MMEEPNLSSAHSSFDAHQEPDATEVLEALLGGRATLAQRQKQRQQQQEKRRLQKILQNQQLCTHQINSGCDTNHKRLPEFTDCTVRTSINAGDVGGPLAESEHLIHGGIAVRSQDCKSSHARGSGWQFAYTHGIGLLGYLLISDVVITAMGILAPNPLTNSPSLVRSGKLPVYMFNTVAWDLLPFGVVRWIPTVFCIASLLRMRRPLGACSLSPPLPWVTVAALCGGCLTCGFCGTKAFFAFFWKNNSHTLSKQQIWMVTVAVYSALAAWGFAYIVFKINRVAERRFARAEELHLGTSPCTFITFFKCIRLSQCKRACALPVATNQVQLLFI